MSDNPSGSQLVIYQSKDGKTRISVRFEDETVWLTQKLMSELFQTTVANINIHIKNIFKEGELQPGPVIKDCLITAVDGKKYQAKFYNLDMIISVGYRVRSAMATRFRQWATQRLREYIVKGFVMDDERLKNPPGPGVPDYFDELLERIRDIRASERRMYLRVREILALAADYSPGDAETQVFFRTVQNKLHFAVTGKTAPELIAGRADGAKPNMGLTAWKGGAVRKADVSIAKNYLHEEEITELNRIVSMFLDYADGQARRRKQVFMADWKGKLDEFLRFHERGVLPGAGKVSHEAAVVKAEREYEVFSARRRSELESRAEQEIIHQLEQTAKELPIKEKRNRKDKD